MTGDAPAMWLIEFACGHRQRRDLSKRPAGQRKAYARWLSRGMCGTCWRIAAGHRQPVPDRSSPTRSPRPTVPATDALATAAGLLLAVGWANPDVVDAGARLHCLVAAGLLRTAGAPAATPDVDIDPADAPQLVREALAALADLPDDLFAAPAVLDAAGNARAALAALG